MDAIQDMVLVSSLSIICAGHPYARCCAFPQRMQAPGSIHRKKWTATSRGAKEQEF
jgi:hypothetical protein